MWEHNRRATMLPLRLFRNRAFSAGNTAIFFLNAGLTGAIFFMAQFQQIVLEQDPLNAGLRLLPWGIAPFVLAPFAGSLADRLGSRPLAVVGLLLQAVGSAWIALIATTQIDYANLIAALIGLQEVTGDGKYLLEARAVAVTVLEHFSEGALQAFSLF